MDRDKQVTDHKDKPEISKLKRQLNKDDSSDLKLYEFRKCEERIVNKMS